MYNGSFDLSNESKPIRDIAYDRLKHAIITGELPAGSRIVETTYAEQLHISRTPLREALSAFVDKTQEHVTGTVRLKLYKGNMINAGITSPYSLYSENLVTFGESDFNQAEAEGFINIWGLPTKVQALREQGKL